MVYLKGIFMMTTIIIVMITICNASTKLAYKKPIYGKSNILKDRRIPQKATISPKAQDIVKTTSAPTTTTSAAATTTTTSTTTANAMTTTILEPTAAIVNNRITEICCNNTTTITAATTTTSIPTNVETPEEPIDQANNNTKDDKGQEYHHFDKTYVGNDETTKPQYSPPPSPPLALSPTSEEEVAAELAKLSVVVPEVDVLEGANSHAVAIVHPAINASATIVPVANELPEPAKSSAGSNKPVPCTCGVFLNSQFKRGSNEQPTGHAVIANELDRHYACNAIGQKQCQTKCLEIMVQHLPNSANILCATLDRDCRKERAYLFIKNCRDKWINTNLAAGREYCCKNGQSYTCPMV